MSVRRRIGLLACFTVGGGTIIVSLLRFIVLKQLALGSRTSYVYGSVCIITTIEFCTAILTANMPALRPVWRKHVSHTLDSGEVGSYDHNSHHELGNVSAIRSRKAGRGSVVLRSRFLDYTGIFMLHCHMMNHEELGMMQTVEVYKD